MTSVLPMQSGVIRITGCAMLDAGLDSLVFRPGLFSMAQRPTMRGVLRHDAAVHELHCGFPLTADSPFAESRKVTP